MIEALRGAAVGAETIEFWLVSAVLAGLAVFALRKGLGGFWHMRTMVDTPTAKIRSAPQGYVELAGRALPYRVNLTAPLTRLSCV
ncbi:MAG: hypothetical protein U9Q81_02735 [Pseudomonadota bacterium]|nr:hypothetical protein [Pseudomonadota bacterium]